MRITVLAVGTRMPAWVTDGVQNYSKRLPRHFQFSIREIPAANRGSGMTPARAMSAEADALLKAASGADRVIALDERGSAWTSRQLADRLDRWQQEYPQVALLIGGADGLDERCRERADDIWSLSPLTLPHALVRVILAEQLYRAWSMLQGHPYHRE